MAINSQGYWVPDNQPQNAQQPSQGTEYWKPPATGFKGVGQDLLSLIKNTPGFMNQLATNVRTGTPGQVKGAFKNPERLPASIMSGIAQTGEFIPSIPPMIADYLAKKELVSPEFAQGVIRPPKMNFQEYFGNEGEMPGDVLGNLMGGFIGGGPMGVEAGIPAARTATQLGKKAASQANPVNFMRGPLSKEELIKNLMAAQGTNTPLGEIIDSPLLKGLFENFSSKTPLGGGDTITGKILNQVQERAESLLEQSGKGLTSQPIREQLKGALENAYNVQRKVKNDLYTPVNQLAEKENFSLNLPSFREKAKEQIKNILNSPLISHDNDFMNAVAKLAGFDPAEINVESIILGKNAKPLISETIKPSIAEVEMTASKLYNEGQALIKRNANASDRAIGNLYLDLAKRANDDIKAELKSRGSPELNDAYHKATENYRENYSQFLDKDVYKFVLDDSNFDTIVDDIIKPGKTSDKFTRLQKIQNILPGNQKNLLGNAWLRRSLDKEGNLNAKQFAQLIDKLGPEQFEALFPDPVYRQQLLDYGRLRGMNEKSLSRMANPNTGQTLNLPAQLAGQAATVAGLYSSGHPILGTAAIFAPQLAAKGVNKVLTSPKVREKLTGKMLKKKD